SQLARRDLRSGTTRRQRGPALPRPRLGKRSQACQHKYDGRQERNMANLHQLHSGGAAPRAGRSTPPVYSSPPRASKRGRAGLCPSGAGADKGVVRFRGKMFAPYRGAGVAPVETTATTGTTRTAADGPFMLSPQRAPEPRDKISVGG